MVYKYMRQLNYLIDTSPDAIINIINGEVSYSKSEKLNMTERIQMFKFFLIKSDIRRQQKKEVLKNVTKVLSNILISEKYRLHIYRAYDLNEPEKNILLKLISFINETDFRDKKEHNDFLKIVKKIKEMKIIKL